MTDLQQLLERVKAASGPDRDLDEAIWLALGAKRNVLRNLLLNGWFPDSYRITASLDAALALVERVLPGAPVNMARLNDGSWMTHVSDFEESAFGPTAPLALLSALLSALAQQEQA